MSRERALKVVLVVVGLIFFGLVYPLTMFVRQEPALAMMLSLYVTLGIFLLLAARNPSANRSLIAFTAWSSFAHAAYGGAGIPQSDPTRRTAGRGGARHHRCSPDRVGSGKAVRRTAIRSQCVGSHSGETPTPTSPSRSRPKRSTRSCNEFGSDDTPLYQTPP